MMLLCCKIFKTYDLSLIIYQSLKKHTLDNSVLEFTDLMRSFALEIFSKQQENNKSSNYKQHQSNTYLWFNNHCHNARKTYKKHRNKYMRKKDTNRQILIHYKNEYNKINRKH